MHGWSLFEGFDEPQKVRALIESLNPQMKMVGHHAECVDRKTASAGELAEKVQKPFAIIRI